LTPFYEVSDVQRKIEEYVADFNKDPTTLEAGNHGPASKYVIADGEIKAKFNVSMLPAFYHVGPMSYFPPYNYSADYVYLSMFCIACLRFKSSNGWGQQWKELLVRWNQKGTSCSVNHTRRFLDT
jgi:hypothetical protein